MNENRFHTLFPDWAELDCGEWSQYGRTFRYGNGEKEYIQIGLYREPMENEEYAGSFTMQVFDGDNVISCHSCG